MYSTWILASLLVVLASLTVALDDPGQACCPYEDARVTGHDLCHYASGFIEGGLVWCYGYYPGHEEMTQADLDAAKCLTNLHYQQRDLCITSKGSVCEAPDSQGNVTRISRSFIEQDMGSDAFGFHPEYLTPHARANKLSAEDSRVMQAAMQHAFEARIRFTTDGADWSSRDDMIRHKWLFFGRTDVTGELISGLNFQYNKGKC